MTALCVQPCIRHPIYLSTSEPTMPRHHQPLRDLLQLSQNPREWMHPANKSSQLSQLSFLPSNNIFLSSEEGETRGWAGSPQATSGTQRGKQCSTQYFGSLSTPPKQAGQQRSILVPRSQCTSSDTRAQKGGSRGRADKVTPLQLPVPSWASPRLDSCSRNGSTGLRLQSLCSQTELLPAFPSRLQEHLGRR